jgi:hypothetical protein
MESQAIDRIIQLNDQSKELVELHGIKHSYKNLIPVLPPLQKFLNVESVDGLIDYIEKNKDGVKKEDCVIHVVNHKQVDLLGAVDPITKVRPIYVVAELSQAFSPFRFDRWTEHEDFMIKLYSLFQTDTGKKLQNFIDTVRSAKRIQEDAVEDKVHSSKRSSSAGIDIPGDRDAFVAKLKPFRTFAEVDQPESSFIFRIRESGCGGLECALFECDGGAWVNAIRKNIKEHLEAELAKSETDMPIFA